MPSNPGHLPDHDGPVDLLFRNKHVRRNTSVKQWRWKQWPWGDDDWDITDWQPAKETEQ